MEEYLNLKEYEELKIPHFAEAVQWALAVSSFYLDSIATQVAGSFSIPKAKLVARRLAMSSHFRYVGTPWLRPWQPLQFYSHV